MNNKYKSRRFWICIWAVIILSISLFREYEPTWLTLIAGIPVAYIASESYTKTHRGKNETS